MREPDADPPAPNDRPAEHAALEAIVGGVEEAVARAQLMEFAPIPDDRSRHGEKCGDRGGGASSHSAPRGVGVSVLLTLLASCAGSTAASTGHGASNASASNASSNASASAHRLIASSAPPSSPAPRRHGFVERRGHCLVRDGQNLRMVGTNSLFMQEDAARESAGLTWSNGRLRAAFDAAQRAGARVLRVTAFNDGQRDVAAIQTELGVYSEVGLVGLDRVIDEAGRRDILLLMVLSNYWPDYGGITQYLRWRGLPDDRGRFFDDPRFENDLVNYAEHLIGRTNTVTGIRYGEDPTILGWEIMNEPRGEGLSDSGEQHTRFLENVARRIKRAAPHQLVVGGDEGFDLNLTGYDMNYWGRMVEARVLGVPRHQSYRMTAASDAFDAATLHFYPEVWGVRLGDEGASGLHWIHEHAVIAMQYNKPVLFEEFGLGDPRRHGPRMDLEPRRRAYEQWFRWSFEEPNFAAVMPWGFTYPGREGDGYAWGGFDPDRDDYLGIVQRWSRRFDEIHDLSECDHPVPMPWPHE